MRQGLTTNRLATLAGLRQSTVENILRGADKKPKALALHRLASVFGMTLSEFQDFPELNEYPIDEEDE